MFRELKGDSIQEMLNSEHGNVTIKFPRDRKSDFEPQVIKKYQKNLGSIEHQIITLYAKGMSNKKIEDFIKNMYGSEVSPSLISPITIRILPENREWQTGLLKRLYAMVFMDANEWM